MLQYINILQCAIYRYSSSGVLYCIAVMNIAIRILIYCNIDASLVFIYAQARFEIMFSICHVYR